MKNKKALKIAGIVVAVLVVFYIIGVLTGGAKQPTNETTEPTTAASVTETADSGNDTTEAEQTTEAPTEADTATLGQKNALSKAESYLKYTSFSEPGLRNQLEYEGFSSDEIDYAMANIVVDWNEQAAAKAESYLKYSSFSREGLADQLEYEGFTAEQIEYALTAVGY